MQIFNAPLYTGCKDDGRNYNKVSTNHPRHICYSQYALNRLLIPQRFDGVELHRFVSGKHTRNDTDDNGDGE